MKLKIMESSNEQFICQHCKNTFMSFIDDNRCPVCGMPNEYPYEVMDIPEPTEPVENNDAPIIYKKSWKSMNASQILKKRPPEGYYYVIPVHQYGFNGPFVGYVGIVKSKSKYIKDICSLQNATIYQTYDEAKYNLNNHINIPMHCLGKPQKVYLTIEANSYKLKLVE